MALNKACCCLSTRTGSLLFLYFFLVNCVWSVLTMTTSLGDSKYKEFLNDNSYIFYIAIFVSLMGSLIFLSTIVSITNNTPSVSLLSTTIAFLILSVIFNVYSTLQYTANGVIEKLYEVEVEKNMQNKLLFGEKERDEFRAMMKDQYHLVLKTLYFMVVIEIFLIVYAVMVFYGFMSELKKNSAGVAVRKNIRDEEANFCQPPIYNLQFSAPQYSPQPPSYSAQVPQCYVEPIKSEIDRLHVDGLKFTKL